MPALLCVFGKIYCRTYTDRCCDDKRNHYKIKRIDYIAEYAVVFIRI